MSKTGTQLPPGRGACIVFGPTQGQKSAKAGFFTRLHSADAAQLAEQAGLMTLKVPTTALPKAFDHLVEGDIGPRGQLRLHPIRAEMLAELRARYLAQIKIPTKATTTGSPASPPRPTNGAKLPPSAPKPPSGSPDLGQLVSAYRVINAAGIWLEKLKVELDEVLNQIGNSSPFSFLSEAETTDYDHYNGGEGWVLDGWRWSYPTRHRRMRIGELSVVVDIGRPDRPAAAYDIPCLLVMWSTPTHNWAGPVDAAKAFWPPHESVTTLLSGRCFCWTGKAAGSGPADTPSLRDGAWFYVVRLAALTSFLELRKLVVQPALALLKGTPVDEALASAAGVMRFRQQGKEFVLDE